jgi:hypothetical protein
MKSDDIQLQPLPIIPGLLSLSIPNPYAKPGAEINFKEFTDDFLFFLRKHCQIHSAAESDALAGTRTSFRKVSIVRAGGDAPVGSQVLKLHETARIKYRDAPATPNLNAKGLEALGIVNALRRQSGGTREADWWLTFSPAPNTEAGWRFEFAEMEETPPTQDHASRQRAKDTEWVEDVLAARVEVALIYFIAYEYDFGGINGKKVDRAKAVAWYHRAAALPPGRGRYVEKYGSGFPFVLRPMHTNGSAAKCNLADKYEHGQGVPQDYQKALFWYNESAKQDNGVAESSLAEMFADGRGMPRDIDAAIACFERAAVHGYGHDKDRLAKLRKERV